VNEHGRLPDEASSAPEHGSPDMDKTKREDMRGERKKMDFTGA